MQEAESNQSPIVRPVKEKKCRADLWRELIGQRCHQLLILDVADRSIWVGGRMKMRCKCDCGNITHVRIDHLRKKTTKSCGCLGTPPPKSHGLSSSPLYQVWRGMLNRCYNEKLFSFRHYGGRGIKVCDRWLNGNSKNLGFECFVQDMVARPSPKHSIERIDNNGDYCPENCRWATMAEQALNRRSTHSVEMNGKTQPIAAWARELGINVGTIHSRICSGLNEIEALQKPIRKRIGIGRRMILWNGKQRNVTELCNEYGISVELFRSRMRDNWTVERALTTNVLNKRTT